MFAESRSGLRCPAARVALIVVLACAAQGAQGAQGPASPEPRGADAVWYRVFLRDGGTIVSYGEFARVADRVVVSMPVGGTEAEPVLHVVTLAEQDVDWERTNAYSQTARARRYAETRGEADYAQFSREVADTLNRIVFVDDPATRLALAESARRRLVEWPQQHYYYRAAEIADMAAWLDQVVMELRVVSGQSAFDLSLVAGTPPPPPDVQMLPLPTAREQIDLALAAAERTGDAYERTSLLETVLRTLTTIDADAEWAAAARARASARLEAEARIDRAYAGLTDRTLARAEPLVRRGDVRGLESLVQSVLRTDRDLRRARPAAMAALLATLDARVDAARRLRLARDAWAVRASLIRDYWRDIRKGLDRLLGVRTWLVDVRQLAGPAPRSVRRLADVAVRTQRELSPVLPPAEARSAHATLLSAASLAARAGAGRLDALRTGDMATAWQASSAAAGALMLLDQAVDELRRLSRPPTLEGVEGSGPR